MSDDAVACLVALAFVMGSAAGGSVELLHWRPKVIALQAEVLRLREKVVVLSRWKRQG